MPNSKKKNISNKKESNIIVKVSRDYKYPTGVLNKEDKLSDAINKARTDFVDDAIGIASGTKQVEQITTAEIIEKTFKRNPESVKALQEDALRGREFINSFIDQIVKQEAIIQFGSLDPNENPDIFDKIYKENIEDENGDSVPDEEGDYDLVLSTRVEDFIFGRTRYYRRIASLVEFLVID